MDRQDAREPYHDSLVAELTALPPGSLVPRDWILGRLTDPSSPLPSGLPSAAIDLTVEALASLFGKRPSTVRAWVERGDFPGAYKLHRREWRVPRSALDAFQQAQRAGGSPKTPADLSAWRTRRAPPR